MLLSTICAILRPSQKPCNFVWAKKHHKEAAEQYLEKQGERKKTEGQKKSTEILL